MASFIVQETNTHLTFSHVIHYLLFLPQSLYVLVPFVCVHIFLFQWKTSPATRFKLATFGFAHSLASVTLNSGSSSSSDLLQLDPKQWPVGWWTLVRLPIDRGQTFPRVGHVWSILFKKSYFIREVKFDAMDGLILNAKRILVVSSPDTAAGRGCPKQLVLHDLCHPRYSSWFGFAMTLVTFFGKRWVWPLLPNLLVSMFIPACNLIPSRTPGPKGPMQTSKVNFSLPIHFSNFMGIKFWPWKIWRNSSICI